MPILMILKTSLYFSLIRPVKAGVDHADFGDSFLILILVELALLNNHRLRHICWSSYSRLYLLSGSLVFLPIHEVVSTWDVPASNKHGTASIYYDY
jgi:hypothetical protein